MRMRRGWVMSLVLGAAGAASAQAADLALSVSIPRLDVAEYHRPYVAMWIEQDDQTFAANLAVWYDLKMRNNEGTKWLKDLRQWWRRSGRTLQMPVDGLAGATRPVGTHVLTFAGDAEPLKNLARGRYQVVVEAAREVGGRELLRVPFEWPPKAEARQVVQGTSELGELVLTLKP
ncbi:MAG: DUF2271 domain-containing protein [Gammaproteobacteria bacterium]|nr:DUF2271 domain-containing protein [Gammaproteobacteria bacterium]